MKTCHGFRCLNLFLTDTNA